MSAPLTATRRTRSGHVAPLLTVAVLLGVGVLAGCSGNEAPSDPSEAPEADQRRSSPRSRRSRRTGRARRSPAASEASEETSESAAETLALPRAPKARDSVEGRKAFTGFVVKRWGYALATNKATALSDLSAKGSTCRGCKELEKELDKRRKQGWAVDFPGASVDRITVKGAGTPATFEATAIIDIPASRSFFEDGTVPQRQRGVQEREVRRGHEVHQGSLRAGVLPRGLKPRWPRETRVRVVDRRTVVVTLASLGGSAALLLSGCGPRAAGRDLDGDDDASAGPDDDLTSDERLVATALAGELVALETIERTRTRHPRLRAVTTQALATHQAHVRLLRGTTEQRAGGDPRPQVERTVVPRQPQQALTSAARSEAQLSADHAATAMAARSGALARVLASMAAASAQLEQVLARSNQGSGR